MIKSYGDFSLYKSLDSTQSTGGESTTEISNEVSSSAAISNPSEAKSLAEEDNMALPEETLSRYGKSVIEAMKNNGEIDPTVISKIDEYMLSSSEEPIMMAHYAADLAGVAAGIKPTALVQTMPTELNIDNTKLANLIKQSGLCIADGWEDGCYFVSKTADLANQVKEKFQKLWGKTISYSEDRDPGRLLGYPEIAVAQDFDSPKTVLGRFRRTVSKKRDPLLERYYTHSPEHQEEEFAAYEKPLHAYMEEHCPRAAALLKSERSSSGKKYRW